MTSNDGLWIFCAVVLCNVFGLVLDYALMRAGLTTVTDFSRRNLWAAGIIIGINAAGTVGLIFHFLPTIKGELP